MWIMKGMLLICHVALGRQFTVLSLSFFIYTPGTKTPFPEPYED